MSMAQLIVGLHYHLLSHHSPLLHLHAHEERRADVHGLLSSHGRTRNQILRPQGIAQQLACGPIAKTSPRRLITSATFARNGGLHDFRYRRYDLGLSQQRNAFQGSPAPRLRCVSCLKKRGRHSAGFNCRLAAGISKGTAINYIKSQVSAGRQTADERSGGRFSPFVRLCPYLSQPL